MAARMSIMSCWNPSEDSVGEICDKDVDKFLCSPLERLSSPNNIGNALFDGEEGKEDEEGKGTIARVCGGCEGDAASSEDVSSFDSALRR